MTSWAKVLTVIAFVLSLIFAGMSAVVYAKRAAYRQMYETEQKLHAQDKAADAKKIETKDGQISDLTAEVTNKTTELTMANQSLDARKKEVSDLGASLADTNLKLAAEQAQVTLLGSTNGELTKYNEDLVATNDKIRTENKDLIAKLSTEQDLTRKLQGAVAELEKTRDTLQTQLAQAKDTIALNEELFAELAKRNVEVRTFIADMQNVPPIDGKVIAVLADARTVALNVGLKQGVRKNFDFTIFRGPDFIAKVNVFDVQERQCAARIITSNGPVKIGDDAQTRLHF